jgi:hypothetical protein
MPVPERDQRGLLGILLAIITGIILVPGFTPSVFRPGGQSTIAPVDRAAATAPDELSGLDVPFQQYMGSSSQGKSLATELAARGTEVVSMIMCVADPDASSLGYRTDLQIDSLQRALMTHRYVIDRFQLPWVRMGKTTRPKNAPGLILFRAAGQESGDGPRVPERLLAVYLVGEVMTSGLDKAAFAEAFAHAEMFTIPRRTCVPVLGPVFTGSTDSLALAIHDKDSGTPDLEASSRMRPWVINFSALGFDESRFRRLLGGSECFFTNVTASFKIQQEYLLQYLKSKGYRRVAWLIESSSGFAAGRIQDNHAIVGNQYVFPAGISQLRDASMNVPGAASRLFTSPTDRTTFAFPAESRSGSGDLLPATIPGMRAAYAELTLRRILADIADRDFDAVGITCTDHRDRVFLVGQLRRHAPAVQILLVGGDLAHEHPAYRQSMLGALVASGSPPGVSQRMDAATPTTTMIALAGDAAFSMFEAVNQVVSSAAAGTDAPPASVPLATWISIIGYQGAWPLSMQAAPATQASSLSAGGFREALGRKPVGLAAITSVFLVLSLFVSGAVRRLIRCPDSSACDDDSPRDRRPSPTIDLFRPVAEWCVSSPGDGRRRLGGLIVLGLTALWIPTTAVALVSTGALRIGCLASTHGDAAVLWWLGLAAAFLAPWPRGPKWHGLWHAIPVIFFMCTWPLVPGEERLLAIIAALAIAAGIHLWSALLGAVWHWFRGDRTPLAGGWMFTAAACSLQMAIIATVGPLLITPESQPWLFSCAWVLNGVSPIISVSAAGIALAAISLASFSRRWRAAELDVRQGNGRATAPGGDDQATSPCESRPLANTHDLGRLANVFGWGLWRRADGDARPLSLLQVTALVGGTAWLLLLAWRLKPVYPSLAAHWICVALIVVGYMAWGSLLTTTASVIGRFLGVLAGFGREIDRDPALSKAFADAVPDLQLGRFLCGTQTPPPEQSCTDVPAAVRRMLDIKGFVTACGAQLRALGFTCVIGALLLLLATMSLPCQPRRWLGLTATLSFIALAIVMVRAIVQFDSDIVLSRIAGTAPGRPQWDWTLLTRIAVLAGVPLLLLVGEAFPELWAWVGAAIEG